MSLVCFLLCAWNKKLKKNKEMCSVRPQLMMMIPDLTRIIGQCSTNFKQTLQYTVYYILLRHDWLISTHSSIINISYNFVGTRKGKGIKIKSRIPDTVGSPWGFDNVLLFGSLSLYEVISTAHKGQRIPIPKIKERGSFRILIYPVCKVIKQVPANYYDHIERVQLYICESWGLTCEHSIVLTVQ